jgi:hypothetical protein
MNSSREDFDLALSLKIPPVVQLPSLSISCGAIQDRT